MKRSLPVLALFAAIVWAGCLVKDPRDAQASAKPHDTTQRINACNGHIGDIDDSKVIPGHPYTIHILCQDQTVHTYEVR